MKPNPHHSKDSTSNSNKSPTPPPSPTNPPLHHDSPKETNPNTNEGETILKTALEVLAELSAGDDEIGSGEGSGAVGATVMTADGSGVVVGVGGRGRVREGGQPLKKRKSNDVKDPPPGKPTCPECKREFFTWKAAFGHMRKHPNRAHRGFFPPPVFSSSSTATINPPAPQPIQNEGDGENRAMEIEAGPSVAAGAAPEPDAEEKIEERKNLGFDLNKMPPNEEDEV